MAKTRKFFRHRLLENGEKLRCTQQKVIAPYGGVWTTVWKIPHDEVYFLTRIPEFMTDEMPETVVQNVWFKSVENAEKYAIKTFVK